MSFIQQFTQENRSFIILHKVSFHTVFLLTGTFIRMINWICLLVEDLVIYPKVPTGLESFISRERIIFLPTSGLMPVLKLEVLQEKQPATAQDRSVLLCSGCYRCIIMRFDKDGKIDIMLNISQNSNILVWYRI